MKKSILTLCLITLSLIANSQTIPYKVSFADVQIQLDAESRQKISDAVQSLTYPQNSFFNQKVARIQMYFPIIEKILEEENVPDDFKYLTLVESGLNPDAVSPTKAVGFWQFKDFTAQELGLNMNRNQDDRKNIHLSTHAAAQYLKKNNQIFKNWISTTLSYTIGAGGAASIVPVEWSFANEIKLGQEIHPYLVSAIANKLAFEELIRKLPATNNSFLEYPARGKQISQIASELNIPEANITENNSWLSANTVPVDKDYIILIKTDKTSSKELNQLAKEIVSKDYLNMDFPRLKRLTMVVTSNDDPVFYEINGKKGILAQPGDEIPRIAAKGKVKLTRFLTINDLTDRDRAREGLVYYLQKKKNKAEVEFHTLDKKQTLWDVAHNYGVKLKKLKKRNRITENEEIKEGRILYLRKNKPKNEPVKYNTSLTPPPELFSPEQKVREDFEELEFASTEPDKSNTSNASTHTVGQGETLFSIAQKYNLTVEELKRLNNMGNYDNSIKVNQILIIEPGDDNMEDTTFETEVDFNKSNTEVEIPKNSKTNATESKITRHLVARGETLFSLANRYGLSVQELRSLNNMTENDVLKAGEYLKVSGSSNETYEKPAAKTSIHQVKRGETLFSISKQYELTVDQLKAMNQLTDNNIQVGQKLIVGSNGNFTTVTPNQTQYYTVKRGDTLFKVSRMYDVSVSQLKEWNNMTSDNLLIGKRIIVKK